MKSSFYNADTKKVRLRAEPRSAFVVSLEMLLMCVKGVYVCTDLYKEERSITECIAPFRVCKKMQVTTMTQTGSVKTHISYKIH